MRRPRIGRRRGMRRLRLRRGVYLFPSLLTTANIFCGFTSIMLAFQSDFRTAALLIIVAGILDGLDGRIARMSGGTSEFGGEYDSLADVVSFGLAPALLAYVWGLAPLRRYGWGLAFVFLVCGAIRLARFNIQHGASDRRWFIGLPIPMAAACVAGAVLLLGHRLEDRWMGAVFGAYVLAISLLMVSRFRYRSFKDFDLLTRRPFRTLLLIVAAFTAIAANYRFTIFTFSIAYAASGPVTFLLGAYWSRGKQDFPRAEAASPSPSPSAATATQAEVGEADPLTGAPFRAH